ncbi:MAG: hypothetical protein O9972_47985 [Burkholderiales bacterium]|nr:hypothetical protein [Burkholderiales bacterium]
MQFRLTYSGPLLSTGNIRARHTDPRADAKHSIRQGFHKQLRRLWSVTPFLRSGHRSGPSVLLRNDGPSVPGRDRESVAERHQLHGWRFVPLVTRDLRIECKLDVLFLRDSVPGHVVRSGDLDGRLKTLLDCLTLPLPNQGYAGRARGEDEDPFHVLLENDDLVTKISVETDQLLDTPPRQDRQSHAQLVIQVTLRPFDTGLDNLQFS